jgi:hypothetical protein
MRPDPRHPLDPGPLDWGRAVNAGLMGAAAMTAVTLATRSFNLSSLNLELLLGSLVTSTSGFGPWALGFCIHLLIGAAFGVVYAAIMETFERSGLRIGLEIAVLHLLLAGFLLPVVGTANPLVRSGSLPSPGPFASGLGGPAVITFIFIHLLFGAIVGSSYLVVSPAAKGSAPAEAPHRPPTALRRG